MSVHESVQSSGFQSAILATIFSLAYVVIQLVEWLGMVGSDGGPESGSTVAGLALPLTPSLLLAPSFLVLVISIHHIASPERKIYSHVATAFATAHGLLLPFLALQMYFHSLIYVASLWAITFPASTWLLAIYFRRMKVSAMGDVNLSAIRNSPPQMVRETTTWIH